ncbi:MAG: glycosyltransferase [Acidaminococcaceae bacterium]|nr:glycosyltransferase [Acidaminococcaceae bacterium]
MPKLSIIVPVYKVEQYIHKCVDSILNQSFTDFELILVDDGSPDNCGKICDEYAQKDKRVRVIHKENGGLSDARNAGIDVASGQVIGFVDSDDWIERCMYEEMLSYMKENNLDIVCADTNQVKYGKAKFKPRYSKNKIWVKDEAICEILNGTLDNAAWNKIYKRSVIGNVRYPKGRIYEDVATTYKFISNSEKVGYISKPYYNYLKRKGSIVASGFNSKSRYDCFLGYRERLNFAKKNNLGCVNDCELLALETALAVLTAFYANDEDRSSERFIDVSIFINEHLNIKYVNKMRLKHKFLLWSFKNCKSAHKLYAKLSGASKRV